MTIQSTHEENMSTISEIIDMVMDGTSPDSLLESLLELSAWEAPKDAVVVKFKNDDDSYMAWKALQNAGLKPGEDIFHGYAGGKPNVSDNKQVIAKDKVDDPKVDSVVKKFKGTKE